MVNKEAGPKGMKIFWEKEEVSFTGSGKKAELKSLSKIRKKAKKRRQREIMIDERTGGQTLPGKGQKTSVLTVTARLSLGTQKGSKKRKKKSE